MGVFWSYPIDEADENIENPRVIELKKSDLHTIIKQELETKFKNVNELRPKSFKTVGTQTNTQTLDDFLDAQGT